MSLNFSYIESEEMLRDNGSGMPYPISDIFFRNLTLEERREVIRRLQDKMNAHMNIYRIDETALIILLVAYVILIVTGATGNGLVCMAVARKPAMRTARNVYIINLAISDLILCLFTMPFSLLEITLRFWPLGLITCKLMTFLEATSIFVSTISITAIALDRYKVIVYPTQESCKATNAFATLSCIWFIALVLSTPLFLYRTVDHYDLPKKSQELMDGPMSIAYCVEDWPDQNGRFYYSLFSMTFQYMVPIVIVSIAYARILKKLKYRMATKGTKLEEKQERDKKRVQKTNSLLISITVIFVLSWLPLNILNVYADAIDPMEISEEDTSSKFRILFACCHMAGMSSACSNPFLYGWLNDNFRKEFKEIFSICCPAFTAKATPVESNGRNESVLLCSRNTVNKHPTESTAAMTQLKPTNYTNVESSEKYDTIVISKQNE